jgi:ribonuclease VapC
MFIDASALVSILNEEEDADVFENRISTAASAVFYSDIVVFEAVHAVARVRAFRAATTVKSEPHLINAAHQEVESFLRDVGALHVPITSEVGTQAIAATRTYGKVVAHKAALNLGDCYSYGCAKALSVPLMYKGQDFALTDLA